MTNLPNDKDTIIETMVRNKNVRRKIVGESLSWFLYYYFGHYIKHEMAPFHHKMFEFAEDESTKSAVIVAFRGSAKSTILTLAFPVWAILGKQKVKHILILSGTQQKAQDILQNIKRELETNRMLQSDLGPFREEKDEWNLTSLYIPRYDAKITIRSVGQSIRGIRFKEHRPQIILLDDIEDLESVKTKESRDKIENWLMGEVIPAGEQDARIFVIGNLLHNDSVMKRLEKRIEAGKMNGKFLKVPFLDENGKPTWPGKFPDQTSIDAEKSKGLSEVAYRREMMLEIIPEEDQIITEDMIQYYNEIPSFDSWNEYRFSVTGVDLAISEKTTADYTTAVSVHVFGYGKDRKIYVLPHPLNVRVGISEAIDRLVSISRGLGNNMPTRVFVEDVGLQRGFVQILVERGIPAEGVPIFGHDKRSRVMTMAPYIKSGAILFPKRGCENLITQIVGFGIERHDDLVDALTLIVLKLPEEDNSMGRLITPTPPTPPKINSARSFRDRPEEGARLEKQAELDFYNAEMRKRGRGRGW